MSTAPNLTGIPDRVSVSIPVAFGRTLQGMAIRASNQLDRISRGVRTWATASNSGGGGYRAGRTDRSNPDWQPPLAGPNLLADWGLDLARRRCRDLISNHPNLAGAQRKLAGRVVGTGIGFRVNTEWDDLNVQLQAVLERACSAVDTGREQSMTSSQREWVQEIFAGGDVLTYRPFVPSWRGRPSGPALQLVVAERLPLEANTLEQGEGRPRVRQGVEFDRLDRRVAYRVLREHPNDGTLSAGMAMGINPNSDAFLRIGADHACLGFLRTATGQVRGVPLPIAAIATVGSEGKLSEAALMQALMASCIGLVVTGAAGGLFGTGTSEYKGGLIDPATGKPFPRLFPGMIANLPHGVDLKDFSPNVPSSHVQEFLKSLKRDEAAASGSSFSSYTGDYSGTTFSAARAEELDARVILRWIQGDAFDQHTLPYLRDVARTAIAAGRVTLTAAQQRAWRADPYALLEIEPRWPGWEWVNPQQEAKAAETEISMGTASRAMVAARRGVDVRSVIDDELDLEEYEQSERERRGLEKPAPPAFGAAGAEDDIDPETGDDKPDPDDGENTDDSTTDGASASRVAHPLNGDGAHAT